MLPGGAEFSPCVFVASFSWKEQQHGGDRVGAGKGGEEALSRQQLHFCGNPSLGRASLPSWG